MSNKMDTKTMGLMIAMLIVIAVGALAMSGMLQFSMFQGFTIKSISLAYPTQEGQSNEWVITALINGWGQSIIGNWDSTDINYQGAKAKYPLKIDGEISKNDGYYLIDNSNPKNIYTYNIAYKKGSITEEWFGLYKKAVDAPACDGNPDFEIVTNPVSVGWVFSNDKAVLVRWCIYKNNIGVVADVSAFPIIVPTVKITVSAKSQSETIEMKGGGVYAFKNGLGSVSWVNSPVQAGSLGILSFGNSYVAISQSGGKTWKVAYRNDYQGAGVGQSWSDTTVFFDGKLNDFILNDVDPIIIGCSRNIEPTNEGISNYASCVLRSLNEMAAQANNLAMKLTNSNVNINNKFTYYGEENQQKGFWVNLGDIYATTPELIFKIKSEWIGILYPNGIPQIVSQTVTPTPFRSGEPLTILLQVKNIGEATGSFIVQDFSCGSLKPEAQIYPVSVKVGETKSITFKMTSSYLTEEAGYCSGKIVDTGSLKSADWNVYYNMIEPKECINGQTSWFGGNVIQECINGKLVDKESCEFGVTADENGKWVCAESPDFCKENPNDPKCKEAEFPTDILIYLLLPLIGGLAFYSAKRDWVYGLMGGAIGLLGAIFVLWIVANPFLSFLGGIAIWVVLAVVGILISTFAGLMKNFGGD